MLRIVLALLVLPVLSLMLAPRVFAVQALAPSTGSSSFSFEEYDPSMVALPTPKRPDLSGYTRKNMEARLAAIPAKPPKVALRKMFKQFELHDFTDGGRAREWATRQLSFPKAIYINSGVVTLKDIARQVGNKQFFEKLGEHRYMSRLPIVVTHNATLVMRGDTLRLSQDRGAFLVVDGQYFAFDSMLIGWNEAKNEPAPYTGPHQFRPFMLGWGGSQIYMDNDFVANLGYDQSKSYGVSLSQYTSGSKALLSRPRPTGWILHSRFEHIYYGFYCYEAENVVILKNHYRNNIIYGIDPHDRSRHLIIADNDVSGSHKKHGIIVSRDVDDSWIIDNRSHDNTLSGIVLDRSSEHNVVAWNRTYRNGGDGITLYESPNNIIWGNKVVSNKRNGIRVRNSTEVKVYNNQVLANGTFGVVGQTKDLSGTDRNMTEDPYKQEVSLTLVGGELSHNGSGPVFIDPPQYLYMYGVDLRFPSSGNGVSFRGVLDFYHDRIIRAMMQKKRVVSVHPVKREAAN